MMAAMMAATNWPDFADGLPVDLLRSATAVSGLFDLAPLIETSINTELKLDRESARQFSPLFRLPRSGTALTVAVGGGETDEFLRQSRLYAEQCRVAGQDCELLSCADLNHYPVLSQLVDANAPLSQALLR